MSDRISDLQRETALAPVVLHIAHGARIGYGLSDEEIARAVRDAYESLMLDEEFPKLLLSEGVLRLAEAAVSTIQGRYVDRVRPNFVYPYNNPWG